jgi:hypothetical protein
MSCTLRWKALLELVDDPSKLDANGGVEKPEFVEAGP